MTEKNKFINNDDTDNEDDEEEEELPEGVKMIRELQNIN